MEKRKGEGRESVQGAERKEDEIHLKNLTLIKLLYRVW